MPYDEKRHIGINRMFETGESKNCYSDYEELAFGNPNAKWVQTLREAVKDIALAFARERPAEVQQDFCDLVFYSAIHVLSAHRDAGKKLSEQKIQLVVETVAYSFEIVGTNDYIVRSGIDWTAPASTPIR